MEKKTKIRIGIVAAIVAIVMIAWAVLTFCMKTVQTEDYSISMPILYANNGDDTYTHIMWLFLANDIEIGSETAAELAAKGHGDVKTAEDYLRCLAVSNGFYRNAKSVTEGDLTWREFEKSYSGYVFRYALCTYEKDGVFWSVAVSSAVEDFDSLEKQLPDIFGSFKIK